MRDVEIVGEAVLDVVVEHVREKEEVHEAVSRVEHERVREGDIESEELRVGERVR